MPETKEIERRSGIMVCSTDAYEMIVPHGYTKLSKNPEIQGAVNHIAEQISIMTIRLMHNTKNGNERIVNELSRKVDIEPSRYLTRSMLVKKIVRDILIKGNSILLPHYVGTYLDDLQPLQMSMVQIIDKPYGYTVRYNGVTFQPDEILNFSYNEDPEYPWHGRGLAPVLTPIAKRMAQLRETETKIAENPMPSIIVKVDGLTEEFSSVEGRKKLRAQYLDSSEAGEPWFIPAEAFDVEKVSPLNLNDLAIADTITLDKRTLAAAIGVPPFLVGEGKFEKEEYNNFVSTKLLPIVRGIEQVLTRGLLLSPSMFFQMNPRSLYSYSITELVEVDCNMVDRAIIDRNEVRDDVGRDPREGLSELAILENYIPYTKIGDQKKLKEKGEKDAT